MLISKLAQAAVDCWLFSTREKPWRHIPDTGGGFWESLKFWTGWKGVSKRRVVRGPGKTREEMVKEARSAYRRRDVEIAQRRERAVAATASRANGDERPKTKRGDRSWWDDETGLDGGAETRPATSEGKPLGENEESGSGDSRSHPGNNDSIPESESTLRNSDTARSCEQEEADPIKEEVDTGRSLSDGKQDGPSS